MRESETDYQAGFISLEIAGSTPVPATIEWRKTRVTSYVNECRKAYPLSPVPSYLSKDTLESALQTELLHMMVQ